MSYGAACRALRQNAGGILHIHGNAGDGDEELREVRKLCAGVHATSNMQV